MSLPGERNTTDEYVMLMMEVKDDKQKNQLPWDGKFTKYLRQTMNLTLEGKGKKHYRIHGKCFDFGWISMYSKTSDASYARLSKKKGVNVRNVRQLHRTLADDIICMCNSLNGVLAGVIKKGQSVTKALLDYSQHVVVGQDKLTSMRGC